MRFGVGFLHESGEVGDLLGEELVSDIEALVEGRRVQRSPRNMLGDTCLVKGGNEGWRQDVIPL